MQSAGFLVSAARMMLCVSGLAWACATGANALEPVAAAGDPAAAPPIEGPPPPPPERRPRDIALMAARSWAYQLQGVRPDAIARSPFDVVVIDYSRDGNADQPLSRSDVRRMQKKPDGSRRIVLAYMSVGEAEDYRFYWREDWLEVATPDPPPTPPTVSPAMPAAPPLDPSAGVITGVIESLRTTPPPTDPPARPGRPDRWLSKTAPVWLGDENEQWDGNFEVKYWDPGWQALLFGDSQSYLARVMAAGFDGVYLDRVDAFYAFQDERPQAADEMVSLVVALAATARAKRPDFLVIPQNGEELLLKPHYVDAIDALAKEDLLYGSPTTESENSPLQLANSLRWITPLEAAGKRVFVVEYLSRPELQAAAAAKLASLGYVATFAGRDLDRLERLPERSGSGGPALAPAPAPAVLPSVIRRPPPSRPAARPPRRAKRAARSR